MCGVEREELARETSLQDGGLIPRSSAQIQAPKVKLPSRQTRKDPGDTPNLA